KEMRKEYETLIPQLPYVGGSKNIMSMYLIDSVSMLAVFRVLEKEGLKLHEIGKLCYEFYETMNERRPRPRAQIFNKDYINVIKVVAKESQLKRYPEDWVMEFVESDGKTFDYGFNFTECGVCKFFKQQRAEHYIPFICLADFAEARASGYGLKRTQTIGNGAPICDFRFSKNGNTPRGWPPDDLPEYKKK
ncbi:MAG: L-2-amino-thiazoline-4-carboxylic acid hydrolase, partial [Candidatus Hodarchaeota archaeon]